MRLSSMARRLPESVWAVFEPILPPVVQGGWKPASDRACLRDLPYLLATNMGWAYVPSCFPCGQTIQDVSTAGWNWTPSARQRGLLVLLRAWYTTRHYELTQTESDCGREGKPAAVGRAQRPPPGGCGRFLGVQPMAMAKWVAAHRAGGDAALAAMPTPAARGSSLRSRRPRCSLSCSASRQSPQKLARPAKQWQLREIDRWLNDDSPTVGKSQQEKAPRADRRDGVAAQPAGATELVAHRSPPGGGLRRRHCKRVSMIGAVTVSPVSQRLGFYFATEVDGYFAADKVVDFLRDLLRHLQGRWCCGMAGRTTRGEAIREFLRRNPRLRLEQLPAYAPDLNPVEPVWSWLKWGRLSNFAPDTLDELDDWVVEWLVTLKHDPDLLRALWERSDLPLPDLPSTR